MGLWPRKPNWGFRYTRISRVTERPQIRTYCALRAPRRRLHSREGNIMKKSIACMLAGIATATIGISACASSGSTTTITTATNAASPISTSYTDKNGYACASAQASSGYCPEDPASKPYSQPSPATSSTVAASSTPTPARKHRATPAATTLAPAPPPPTTAPATAPSTPSGCYPLSDENTCYEPGEYCRDSDHGTSGVAGDGKRIICEDNDGWRWEPA